jgi:cellulose biosynthesis protein BcsQ
MKLIIIDTAGKSTDAAIAAAKAADRVLMPIQPQVFDIETLQNVKEILILLQGLLPPQPDARSRNQPPQRPPSLKSPSWR